MNLDSLLDSCLTLENTISTLVKNNSFKQLELKEIQNLIFERTQNELNDLADKENKLKDELEQEKQRREAAESQIRQYSIVNEKLNELVALAQKTNQEKKDDHDKNDELQFAITQVLQDYEHIRQEFAKAIAVLKFLHADEVKDSKDLKELTEEGRNLVISLQQNENIIRALDQQNKFAEQQFDLILNQVPWEPLTQNNINELLQSSDEGVRELAVVLDVQTSEMFDLTESMNLKKKKKLDILEQLADVLNDFVKKRSASILMDNHHVKFRMT